MDTSLLAELGLSPGEIKVYLTLLEYGTLKTGDISKYAQVHTSKVYLILDRLIEKGLCSYVLIGKVKHFQSADPEQLFEYVKQKKHKLESQEKELKELLPKIKERQKLQEFKQSAAVFEGYRGVKTMLDELLIGIDNSKNYVVFSPGEEFADEQLNKVFKKHQLERIERNIKVKVLALDTQRKFYKKDYKKTIGFEFRYSPLSLPAGINIVGNKVSFIIGGNYPTGYLIESEQLAKRFSDFFHRLWLTASE